MCQITSICRCVCGFLGTCGRLFPGIPFKGTMQSDELNEETSEKDILCRIALLVCLCSDKLGTVFFEPGVFSDSRAICICVV